MSHFLLPVGSHVGSHVAASASHLAAQHGLPFLIHLAQQHGVTLIEKTRRLYSYDFNPLSDSDLQDLDSRECSAVLICSIPLPGLAGFTGAGRHFVSVFISSTGYKEDRFMRRQLFHFTAYAFDFGSARGPTMEGPGAICISTFDMSVESRHRNDASAYARELERHGFKVEDYRPCSSTLRDAIITSVLAGKFPYTLKSYNCKAYSRTVFKSIGQSAMQYVFDDANDKLSKMIAGYALSASTY